MLNILQLSQKKKIKVNKSYEKSSQTQPDYQRHNKEILSWCKAAVMHGIFLTPLWGELGRILGVTLWHCVSESILKITWGVTTLSGRHLSGITATNNETVSDNSWTTCTQTHTYTCVDTWSEKCKVNNKTSSAMSFKMKRTVWSTHAGAWCKSESCDAPENLVGLGGNHHYWVC